MRQTGVIYTVFLLITIATLFGPLLSCSGTGHVSMQANRPPVIEDVIYPKDVFSNSDVEIQCVASDPDGDNLMYTWTADAGNIRGDGASIVWVPPGKMGTYPVSVRVMDGKGGVANRTIEIRVVTNADGTATPTIELKLKLGNDQPVVLGNQRARIWTTTNIVCLVENGGGDRLTYTWSSTGGKIKARDLQEGRADTIGWIAPGSIGDYTVDVVVKDGSGKQARGQVNIHVFCCGN